MTRVSFGNCARSLAVFGLSLVALCACAEDADKPNVKDSHVVEIFSWWTSGGEKDALEALIARHTELHPDTTIINAAVTGSGTNARERLEERVQKELYPDIFQVNAGLDLYTWIQKASLDSTPLLRALDDLPQADEWKSKFPKPVLDAVSYDGKLYAVPVNVHRNNALYYNKKIFDRFGLTAPTTFAELFQVAERLKTQASDIAPFAMGIREPWTLTLVVFENLLVARSGAPYYRDLFTGKLSPEDPLLRELLTDVLKFWTFVNANAEVLNWDEAVGLVANEQAAMTIMGDWAKGYFTNAGKLPGVDFEQIPTPGSEHAFLYNPDCFPLTTKAPDAEGAIELLETFGSVEGQDIFNPIKGSIPARTDADVSRYDAISKRTLEDFRQKELVLALSGLTPTTFNAALAEALASFVIDKDPEVVLEVFRDYYASLSD